MNRASIIQWLEQRQILVSWLSAPVLIAMIVGVYLLVFYTGGIKFVYSHSMYVPIVMAGLLFGFKGGITVGLLGGLALGPWMPIDVATGEMQQTINWLYRTGFFCLIGGISGSASDAIRWYINTLRWNMFHDGPTGLPNREALVAELSALKVDRQNDSGGGLLAMVSMENAEELRVSFGADSVDRLMAELAKRIRDVAGAGAPVYRVDGSKLALHLEAMDEIASTDLMQQLDRCLVQPLPFGEVSVHADVCISLVKLEGRFDSVDELLNYAGSSLALARDSSQRIVIAAGVVASYSRENVALMGQLWRALETEQIQLHYQPKVELCSGRVIGAEALLRWQHPELGMVPPMNFIPRAEQSTLIDDLTWFVVGKALDQAVDWRARGIDLCMAVNVSAQNLVNPNFGKMIRKLLGERHIDGRQFELEVTEGALMKNIDKVSRMLHGLSSLNIVMSIDDFGTGYSSLQYINDLPVTIVKIDKVFIRPLPDDVGSAHIVRATIDLCHQLDMQVVAEGVETADALDLLGDMGCDSVQGYHVARPMPPEEFEQWIGQNEGQFRIDTT